MKASEVTLGQIFFKGQQNVIPLFQRPYVWSETNNWFPLWDDVKHATEDALKPGAKNAKDQRTYFLGAIVLQDRDGAPGQVGLVNVIDGQQRLTTLQILCASAREVCGERFGTVANRFEEMIFNSEKIVHEKHPDDRYKLWPLPQDRPAFLAAVDPQNHPVHVADHRITEAKTWFTATIGEWAKLQVDEEMSLTVLYETLHKRMQLVQIDLSAADDPQVIFEVLNNRGVQLDAADLVKNLLFQEIEKSQHSHLATHLLEHVWLPLDKAPWRKQVTVGRQTRSQLDVLLSYWLPTQQWKMTTVEHMFADIKAWMEDDEKKPKPKPDPVDVMKSIRFYADLMLALRELPVTNPTGALIDRMTATDVNALWPVVLYLHGHDSIPVQQRDKAIRVLDSFMMRRMLCRLPTNSFSDLMGVLLREMNLVAPTEAGDRLESVLLSQTASGRLWPTDDDVRRALSIPNFYKAFAQKRSRTYLVSLDNALWTPATAAAPSGRAVGSTWTIEHLLPQEWSKNWKIPADSDPVEHERRVNYRNNSVHALGNLTLLTSKLNSTTSNRSWDKKRDTISKQALLLLTTQTVLNKPQGVSMSDADWVADWDESRIHARTQWLIDLTLRLWPRPA